MDTSQEPPAQTIFVAQQSVARSHTFAEIDHEIISTVILPSADSRSVVKKVWLGDRPDMTIAVDWNVKNQTNEIYLCSSHRWVCTHTHVALSFFAALPWDSKYGIWHTRHPLKQPSSPNKRVDWILWVIVEIESYCGISTCSAQFAKNDQGFMSNLKLYPLILQYIQWDNLRLKVKCH